MYVHNGGRSRTVSTQDYVRMANSSTVRVLAWYCPRWGGVVRTSRSGQRWPDPGFRTGQHGEGPATSPIREQNLCQPSHTPTVVSTSVTASAPRQASPRLPIIRAPLTLQQLVHTCPIPCLAVPKVLQICQIRRACWLLMVPGIYILWVGSLDITGQKILTVNPIQIVSKWRSQSHRLGNTQPKARPGFQLMSITTSPNEVRKGQTHRWACVNSWVRCRVLN